MNNKPIARIKAKNALTNGGKFRHSGYTTSNAMRASPAATHPTQKPLNATARPPAASESRVVTV